MKLCTKKVLCIGEANADLCMETKKMLSGAAVADTLLGGGTVTEEFREQVSCNPGGTICTASAALSRLGVPTRFLGSVGNDYFGRFALDYLEKSGVDTAFAVKKETPTLMVFCLIDERGDRDFRLFPARDAAGVQLAEDDVPDAVFEDVGLVYFTGVQLVEQPISDTILMILDRCESLHIPVAFDCNLRLNNFGWNDRYHRLFDLALERSTVIFGSGREELMLLTGRESPLSAAESLAEKGKLVVAKNGAEGAFALHGTERFQIGAFEVEVADTVGAGDNFNAGFLAAYLEGRPLPDCLLFGSASAAISLKGHGGGHGPDREMLTAFLKERRGVNDPVKR